MTWRYTLIIWIASSLLSSIASLIYKQIYSASLIVNFNAVMNNINIIVASTISCILMLVIYKLAIDWNGTKTIGWLNVLFSLVSFISIIGVIGFNLPLELEAPELFIGLAIPMHFFPILSILSIFPLFKINKQKNDKE